jgi:hypothetical protein
MRGGQFLLTLQPRQGDQGADEQADRQDDREQLRHRQQGQFQHDPHALTALDDDLQLIQALRQDADSSQRRAGPHYRQGDLAEKVTLNQGHAGDRYHPVAGAFFAAHLIHALASRRQWRL